MSDTTKPVQVNNQTTHDGLTNVMTGLGTSKSKSAHNRWTYPLLNEYQSLEACYLSDWIARKICDIPAEDMTREWRRVKSDGAEEIQALEQQFLLPNLVQEAITWSNLYGGAGILMLTDQDLTKPLDVRRIRKGSLKGLITLDRYDMNATIINMWDVLAPNYLKPEFYTVRGGSMQVHHSHFARFTGERLPKRFMAQTQGWGDSKLRKCIEEIDAMVAANRGISELMQEANVDVIKREGLTDELSTDQDQAIIRRYQLFSAMKSNIQMALLDGEEDYERKTLNLSGVAPIIEQFMTIICGAADIPMTRFFGTSAKGMNATGEGDDRNYNNSIRAGQRSYLAEPMRVIDEVLVRSALGDWPSDFDYVWNPLSLPNALEIAQANKLQADTNIAYLDANIVQRSQVMRELQAGEEYQFNDDDIDELESMEEGNMFEELPNLAEQPAPLPADPNNVTDFASTYTSLVESGMTHDQAMERLS